MLEKCLIGNLVQNKPSENNSLSSSNNDLNIKSDYKKNTKDSKEKEIKSSAIPKEIPVLDSYQTAETVNIVLYTKCKNLKSDCLIVDKSDANNTNNIILFVYIVNVVYKYVLGKLFFS